MAQFQSPINYVTGDQVTAANLNNHINGAVALPGLISDQSSMSANDVASTDQVLINDGGVLKKTTVGDVLNSNLAATFTSITATNFVSDNVAPGANKDLGLSPNAGVAVTGKTFTSVNGINVTVNSTAHNVLQNQVLTITASIAAYSGEYRVVSVTTDTFEYVLPEAATPNSGSCDYTKTASVVTTGNSVITSDEYLIGNQDVGGNSRINGSLIVKGAATFDGTSNFTGNLQVNGTVGYVLTGVIEETIPYATGTAANTLHNLFTSASYTKPVGEIWVIEIDAIMWSLNNANTHYRLTDSTDTTNFMIGYAATNSAYDVFEINKTYIFDSSSTHTGTFVFRAKCGQPTISISPSTTELSTGTSYPDASKGSVGKFRIYKYKTA